MNVSQSNVEASLPKKRRKVNDIGGFICEFVVEDFKIEGEIWKQVPKSLVPGNKSYVSNLGRVKSYRGVIGTQTPKKAGYVKVGITGKKLKLHRVVIISFGVVPPSAAHNQVNHIDHNRSNNQLDNLEWCTPAQNIQHSYANNPDRKSSAGKRSKPVRGKKDGEEEWVNYESASHAARELGLYQGSISESCKKGCKVKHYRFEFAEPNEQPILPGEEWKKWGPAEISNLGRFKDICGVVKTPLPAKSGYTSVCINGKMKYIHRLVAELFLPPPGPGQIQVDHIDGKGNEAKNLRWATPSQNTKYSFADPNRKSSAPKKSKKVRCQKIGTTEWRTFPSVNDAAHSLGLNNGNISYCCIKNGGAQNKWGGIVEANL